MATSTTNLPSYVTFYGMTRDPFSPEAEEDIFYAEPTRKQRLDVLLHLTEYGNEVMVVIGPKGSGKTAMLQQFQKTKQENWKVASVEVLEGYDERKFLQQLYRQMDLAFRGATFNELLDYMEKHFRQLQENSLIPVILIDNAELLPVTAIKKILELASLTNNDNKPLIRVVMFGTENIKEQLKLPQLGHLVSLPMRSMELPPLNEEQTVHYILHRTLAAKFNGKDIFNESAILKIYRESFGWPARINEICRDMLLKSVPGKNQESLPRVETKSRNPKQLVAAVIAFAVLATVLAFQSNINELIDKSSGIFANLTTETPQSATEASVNQTAEETEAAALPEPTTLVEQLKRRDPAYQDVTNDMEPGKQEPVSTETEKIAIPEPVTTTTVTKPTDVQPENNILNVRQGNDWVLLQSPDHFTMQLVAGENLKTIQDFIDRHKLKDNIALYRSMRKNKPWYGLIYGIYENKQIALTSVDQLPSTLKKLKPWIRPLAGIQKDIRKVPVEAPKKQESLKERLSKPRPQPLPKPQPVQNSKPVPPMVEITRKEEWILRQRYNHYTLQLVASENIETIHQFINRYKLKDSIALYETIQDDKPWHVLIYGIYSNESLATSGIDRLPVNLQLVKPTIRQFSDIHRDVRKITPGAPSNQ